MLITSAVAISGEMKLYIFKDRHVDDELAELTTIICNIAGLLNVE